MIKIKNIFLVIISFLMIAVGCAKIDGAYHSTSIPTNDRGEYAILFNNSSVVTKAAVTTTAGNGYDEFSLYAWNSSNDTIMNPFKVTGVAANSYKYEDVDGQKLQYFKNSADSYSFIGVIPTTNVKVKNGSVKVGVESFVVDDNRVSGTLAADSPKEFLWARADVAKGNYNQPVNLPFQHGNALLYLGFISDDGNTQIVDYTPHVDYQPAQPAVPGTVTTTTKTGKAIDMLVNGEIVYWPYVVNSSLTSSQPNPRYDNGSNYGNMSDVMDAVNAQFVYYNTSGGEMAVADQIWDSAQNTNFKNMYGFKLASTVDKAAFAAGNDAFWTNASDELKTVFQKAYDAGWRVVRIQYFSGNHYCAFLINNTEMEYKVRTETGGSPAVPAVPESGFKGIRVFSAKADVTDGYAHLAHTKTADATVATGLTFDNRVTVTDSILFSLPGAVVPVGTTETQAVYSPTTFYAIPGDAGLTHFVVKVSYTYKGTTVYDVRVPITLPAAGLEAGKYYKYIINIKSTANGTNNPDEANNEKDDIDIVNNPIQVTTTITDYEKGDTQIITI